MAIRTRSARSVVWQFFTKINGKEAKCDKCEDIISTSGNTSNLFKVFVKFFITLFYTLFRN